MLIFHHRFVMLIFHHCFVVLIIPSYLPLYNLCSWLDAKNQLLVGLSTGLMIERLRVWILAGGAGESSSPELTLCADSYLVFVPPPMLLQWHIKDPSHSAKSAGDQLHLNTHTPSTQRTQSGPIVLLSRHSVETYQKQAHMQRVREHSVTVITARWSRLKEWN